MENSIIHIDPDKKYITVPEGVGILEIYTRFCILFDTVEYLEYDFPFHTMDSYIFIVPGWTLKIGEKEYQEAKIMELQV